MKAQDVINQANGGIVGIDEDLNIFGGYDNNFATAGANAERPEWFDAEDWDVMPNSEKHVLADRMIERWKKYKDAAPNINTTQGGHDNEAASGHTMGAVMAQAIIIER